MLRSDLCDYSDTYIVVKGTITITGKNNNRRNKKLTFMNNAPFLLWTPKINNTFRDNVENLDTVMPMYNLLEYTDSYAMTSGSFWNYYRDEMNYDKNENNANGNMVNNKITRK